MGSSLSVVASLAIIRSTINEIIPPELRKYLWILCRRFSSEVTLVIEESHDESRNHLYNAVVTYLGGHVLFSSSGSSFVYSSQRFTVGKSEKTKNITFGLGRNSEIIDDFRDVRMKWKFSSDENNSTQQKDTSWYELCFGKEHLEMVKNKYLPHILEVAKRIHTQNRIVKFHTIRHDRWGGHGINLEHPMTFDTLAMDGELKKELIEDLDSFINAKQYYKKIGKIWKRGYLLYGPPGTGKSSLVAAMANYLNYDIYNLNLSAVNSDSALEFLL
ncbi:AAA-ATPase At2g18193-like, partial [Carica papaya]|uniref:AAA-ATPase At2g18193-like n=1 Tax=Carica papaya TaxID=3649 RepID=UPI000B8CA8A3